MTIKTSRKITIAFWLLFLIFPSIARAKINILSTITPIASLAAMVGGDKVNVSTIASNNGCPHHYSLKPSDLKKLESADFLIYINERFDSFGLPLINKFEKNKVKISALPGIKIIDKNLHLWLLPDNAIAIMNGLYDNFSKFSPQDSEYFKNRLEHYTKLVKELDKERKLINGTKIVLVSDSAEYLFQNISGVKKLYEHADYSSLKFAQRIKRLSSTKDRLFIISSEQNLEKYKKMTDDGNVIVLGTENWQFNEKIEELYTEEYKKILKLLELGNS